MATDDVARALAIKAIQGGGGTTVVANPTLAGTEAALEGLLVGDTKYKVGDDNTGVKLFNETVTVVSSPVSLSLYEDAFNYPVSQWNAKVNGHPMIYESNSGIMRYVDMEAQKAYIIMPTTPYEYSFICIDSGSNPVAGDYDLEIYGEYLPGNGIVHISNLECNKTFAEISYLQSNGYLDCVVNPFGQCAVDCVFTPATSFAVTFMSIMGTSIQFTTYTLDSNDEITTTSYSSNITLTPLT